MKSAVRFFVAVCFVLCLFQTGHADLYSFSGTLSTDQGELVTDSGWSGSGVVLNFQVNQLESGLWSYKYTFTTTSGNPLTIGLANPTSGQKPFLKLQTSDVDGSTYSLVTANGSVSMNVIKGDIGVTLWNNTVAGRFLSDPHLKVGGDTDTAGIAEVSDGIVEIISSQAPMWGDFYLRGYSPGGVANTQPEVVNKGFNEGVFPDPTNPNGPWYGSVGGVPVFDPDTFNPNNPMYWILVPDTRTNFNTPLPAAVWLLGTGLIGLIGFRRFRKK